MTNQELKISATYIKKLASYPDAEERISLYLDSQYNLPQTYLNSLNTLYLTQKNEIVTNIQHTFSHHLL